MRSRNLIASVLFILVGFSAGVGLNLFRVDTIVHGAPGDPNPALKTVAHDSTLTGLGTEAAPLGVVVGGGIGGIRVVDSMGHPVGPIISTGTVLRQIGVYLFQISIDTNGFERDGIIQFPHTSTDCSGPRYWQETGNWFIRNSRNAGTELFYTEGPIHIITINSIEEVDVRGDVDQPGVCAQFLNNSTGPFGLVTKLDLSILGLVPPFHLEF